MAGNDNARNVNALQREKQNDLKDYMRPLSEIKLCDRRKLDLQLELLVPPRVAHCFDEEKRCGGRQGANDDKRKGGSIRTVIQCGIGIPTAASQLAGTAGELHSRYRTLRLGQPYLWSARVP